MNLEGVGILLLGIGVIALIVWFTQSRKAAKIKSVPFKKPSQIGQLGMGAADAKQMVSTEGQMTGQPILAPMSGKPCVYYEIEVVRGYHKLAKDSNGRETKAHGSANLIDQKQGVVFALRDEAGAIGIDCQKAPSLDLKESHRHRVNVGPVPPRLLQFGNMQVQPESLAENLSHRLVGGEITDHYDGIERIVPFVEGQTLYALGKLTQTPSGLSIGEAGWSRLLLSDKGREGALGSAAKSAKIAMIAGAVLMTGGAVCATIGLFVSPASASTTTTTSAHAAASPPHPPSTAAAPPGSPASSSAAAVPTSATPKAAAANPAPPPPAQHPAEQHPADHKKK